MHPRFYPFHVLCLFSSLTLYIFHHPCHSSSLRSVFSPVSLLPPYLFLYLLSALPGIPVRTCSFPQLAVHVNPYPEDTGPNVPLMCASFLSYTHGAVRALQLKAWRLSQYLGKKRKKQACVQNVVGLNPQTNWGKMVGEVNE